MNGHATPVSPRFEKDVAHQRLIRSRINAVPDRRCDTWRHTGTEKLVLHVNIEVKR